MKHLFTLFLFATLASSSLFGQGFNVQQPIKWSCKYEKIDKETYEIILKGVITDSAWHIYDMKTYEDGPNSTTFEIEQTKQVKPIGKPYLKSKVTTKHDEMFDMEIGICEKEAIVAQKVKISGKGEVKVIAVVGWQACNDKTCLVPTEKEFVITIPAK